MSKRQFKSHASSGRAADAVGGSFGAFGLAGFGSSRTSTLSYIQEPPDFSAISDANIVVVLKNLSKKDGTTKAKALEDLQAHIVSMEREPEDALLEAWVKHFPRLSIDSERRVRQLAYNVNGVILQRSGKRAAKHMPQIVGPWLAGTADSDRAAANAADAALRTVFPSVEKLRNLRKVFHGPLLEYVNEAILHESPQTLSDERTVSKEDAEATYARVVASCLYLLQSNLDILSVEELSKQHQVYDDLLGEKRVWDLATYNEVGVRRSMHRLVSSCLAKLPSALEPHLKLASSAYVYKGLTSDQLGSATDFVKTLNKLTTRYPTMWEEAYTGKKPAVSRLAKLLQRGSQASVNYWEALPDLLQAIPNTSIESFGEQDILQQMRDGLQRREERNVQIAAWRAYFKFADKMSSLLPSEEDRIKLIEASVMPVVWHFLYRTPDTIAFAVHAGKASSIVAQAIHVKSFLEVLNRQLPDLSNKLIEITKMSQPEQAKDFTNSQDSVAAAGLRWAELQRDILAIGQEQANKVRPGFLACDAHVVQEMFELLKTRNGKPYGAAAAVDWLLQFCNDWLMSDLAFSALVVDFVTHTLPAMLDGPSQKQLIAILYATGETPQFKDAFQAVLDQVVMGEGAPLESKSNLIKALFTVSTPQPALQIAKKDQKFQELIQGGLMEHAMGSGLFAQMMQVGAISTSAEEEVLSRLTQGLTDMHIAGEALTELEAIVKSVPQSLQRQPASSDRQGQQLLPPLLQLEQSDNDSIAGRAHALSLRLTSAQETAANANRFQIVIDQLDTVFPGSMKVATLIELALRLIKSESTAENLSQMIPSLEGWLSSLEDVTFAPKHSLAILSPLAGALSIVNDGKGPRRTLYDADGFSKPLRIAMYVTALLKTTGAAQESDRHSHARVLDLLALTRLVAEDNISVAGTNAIFTPKSLDNEVEVLDFITEAYRIGTSKEAIDAHFDACNDITPLAYYNAVAYAKATDNTFETAGFGVAEASANEKTFKDLYRTDSSGQLPVLAFLKGNQQTLAGSQVVSRILNELVADLTDADFEAHELTSLRKLLVLNSLLSIDGLNALATVANQRLVFLVRNLIRNLHDKTSATGKIEICRTLARLIGGVKDVYGEHWTNLLSFIIEAWDATRPMEQTSSSLEHSVLLINVTIRLYGALRKLSASDEPNDDLVDALKEHRTHASQGLINILTSIGGLSDEAHQPLSITNEMLAREVAQLPTDTPLQPDELYSMMYTASPAVQQAAFTLLHNHIAATQQQISFDAALENKTATLPDELLSLVLEAPTLDSLADASFDRRMPLSLQGYLFSWRLLFDHFANSSYKVKSDYIEQIKSEGHLPQLLNLVFDFLGHTRGKPVNVSKFNVLEYTADEEVIPEKDVQWLLAHLYYLSLMHLPSLVKAYFLEIRSRQTVQAVEAWTAKHISPLLIASSLQSVAEWAEKSVKDDPEYEKMTVKVGMRSKEVTASYLVDEQTMAIKVILPEVYPLASAQVVGVSRVAVKEEKWQSWLRNCQGVITFSNGSIIDGLSAWRRNVVGALKGQTECAICYSIISGDKQLPTKKCPTCKHLFHNSCLFKWFKTSNANTCPLCRNAFQFN